jgi:hypothetical protein
MAQRFKAKTLISNSGVFNNEVIAPNLVYNTGNQTISGVKTFTSPSISGYLKFSRDNSITIGTPVSFVKTNGGNQVDYFGSNIGLTRGAVGPLYNANTTPYFGNNSANADWANPRLTKWNWDGWADLTNIKSRKYDNFVTVLNNQVGGNIVGAELILYDMGSDQYYLIKFSSWGQGGGNNGFAYVRSLVSFNDPEISKITGYLGVAQNTTFDSSVKFDGPVLFRSDNDYYGYNRHHSTNIFGSTVYMNNGIEITGYSSNLNASNSINLNSQYLNIASNNNSISLNDSFDKNVDQFIYSITLTGAGINEANGVWTRPSGGTIPFTNGSASSNLYWDSNAWILNVYSTSQNATNAWYYNFSKTFASPFSPGNNGTIPTITNINWRSKNYNNSNVLANTGEVVLLVGNQTISGVKTFANDIKVSGSGTFNGLDLNAIDVLSLSGVDITITSGIVNSTNSVTAPNLVYNTGNQTVSGIKTFANSGVFSLSGIEPLNVPSNPLSIVGSGNTYIQLNIQNRATGSNATSDLVLTANNGTDIANYINLGINNSGYNDGGFTNGTGLDGYLFIDGGNLDIGTKTVGKFIEFHAGGTTQADTIAKISSSGLNIVSGNLTVNNTGVVLSGSTQFVINFGHVRSTQATGPQYYYFGPQMDIDPVSLSSNDKRRVQILQNCFLRKVVWTSIAKTTAPSPSDAMTGYFKNFGNNPLTRDDTPGVQVTSGINISASNIMYANSTGDLNIPITGGNYLSFYYQTNHTATAAAGLAINVDAYFYF